jgi:hypothetical protein
LSFYLIKIAITTTLVVAITEIAKRSTFVGALVASVPLISSLAIIWLYIETNNTDRIIALSNSIFWLVIPSLVLFITLPILLKLRVHFYISLGISVALTIAAYWLIIVVANHYGIKL